MKFLKIKKIFLDLVNFMNSFITIWAVIATPYIEPIYTTLSILMYIVSLIISTKNIKTINIKLFALNSLLFFILGFKLIYLFFKTLISS